MTAGALVAADPLVLTQAGILRVVAHAAAELLRRHPPLGVLAGAGPILLLDLALRIAARCRRRPKFRPR